MEEEIPTCAICGDPEQDKYMVTLNCNHSFHYECIMKSFQYSYKKDRCNKCPLCRQVHGLLPIVNGLSRLIKGIHFSNLDNGIPKVNNTKCVEILQSGKRKGEECNCKCMIGFTTCKRHYQLNSKKSTKKKNKKSNKVVVKKVGLGDALEQLQLEQVLEVTGQHEVTT